MFTKEKKPLKINCLFLWLTSKTNAHASQDLYDTRWRWCSWEMWLLFQETNTTAFVHRGCYIQHKMKVLCCNFIKIGTDALLISTLDYNDWIPVLLARFIHVLIKRQTEFTRSGLCGWGLRSFCQQFAPFFRCKNTSFHKQRLDCNKKAFFNWKQNKKELYKRMNFSRICPVDSHILHH